MTCRMASIIGKNIRGNRYYYARECRRVNGKPKIVWQKYLGRADDIVAVVTGKKTGGGPKPREAVVREFGASAALYDLAQRLRIVEFIDHQVPKTPRGPSVGTYLLVAAINRCVAPRSKAKIGEWFDQTVLRRLLDVQSKQLTSQRFWDNMDRVSLKSIEAIEADLTAHLVREFDLDLRQVLFDATNFFSFIDSFNERWTIAQRGKSKEGRASLRIVGLALLVTADFHVPLCHRTYPGNQPDAPTFGSLTSELVARHRRIAEGVEGVTLIFDKGNNSRENLEKVADSPYHFMGSLVPTRHPDLLKIPARRFRSLAELQTQLRRWRSGKLRGKRPTIKGTRKKVDGWLAARHMKDLFHVEISEEDGLPKLKYRFLKQAWQRLERTLLGKTILFTDNDDWSDAEIVRGYRNQQHVESAFREMKNPHHLCLRPQRHWTDQKIAVHVFYCVLALTLCTLLRRELHRQGIDRSIETMLECWKS